MSSGSVCWKDCRIHTAYTSNTAPGLSYTTFSFSSIQIQANGHGPYTPNTGNTSPAPTFGTVGTASSYLYPPGFRQLSRFIYSFIYSTDLRAASQDPEYGQNGTEYLPPGATDGSAQPVHPAGGGLGGNPRLYDVLFTGKQSHTMRH